MPLTPEKIDPILSRFFEKKILVLGDLMLDEFIWGKVSRISPEAPVPVLTVQQSQFYPGGAANVVRNLEAFIPQPSLAGIIGQDASGNKLLELLQEKNVNCQAVLIDPERPTTTKTRISAITRQRRGHIRIDDQHQLVRMDREITTAISHQQRTRLQEQLAQLLPYHDAIIVEDYGKGVLDQTLIEWLATECHNLKKILTIDPNPSNPLQWQGVTCVKPNRREAFIAAEMPYSEEEGAIEHAGKKLLEKWKAQFLLITLGEDGMLLCQHRHEPYHVPTRAKEVFDVSGAGDTAISIFTLALASGANAIQAAELANHAAGIVVGKLGTATVTLQELRQSFHLHHH